jgi:hypothetical protein
MSLTAAVHPAALPPAVTRRDVDWPLTILVAFSFLFHFGVVGATFSDWLDPVVGDEGPTVGIVDLRPAAPAVVEARGEPSRAGERAAAPASTGRVRAAEPARSGDRAASLARDARAMGMSLLGAMSGTPAVESALRRGDVPVGPLDDVARQARGVDSSGRELSLASGGAFTAHAGRLDGLGVSRIETRSARARDVAGPRVAVTAVPDPAPGVIEAERPIALLRPSFRRCYVREGLSIDPSMQGKLTIDIAVAPSGDVASVTRVDGAGLSPAVEACIVARAKTALFPASPGTLGARVRVPIYFRTQ